MEKSRILKAKDCLGFDLNNKTEEEALKEFIKNYQIDNNIFNFSQKKYENDETVLAEYDFRQGKWKAGRFIGRAKFSFKNKDYEIIVEPRFGSLIFFKMVEEIFNIKIVNSQLGLSQNKNSEVLIKKLIAMIWLKKFSNVNKHGFPKKTVKKQYKGYSVRGRILPRQTVIPYYTEEKVVSQSYEKESDYVIARIILEAYNKLNRFYSLSSLRLPSNIIDIIHEIQNMPLSRKRVTSQEYKSIKYKTIYTSYKEIVDFSWLIVKSKDVMSSNNEGKGGMGFFIDMAEVWEVYLKTILQKRFKNDGWKISSDEIEVYKDTFFKRKIIPDIIMEKENKIVVLDAKYKRMMLRKDDLDRSDFFQIHTYMSYYLCQNKLLCGGLLYPISCEIKNNESASLFGESECSTAFFVDGIYIKDNSDEIGCEYLNNFEEAKNDFLNRISAQINKLIVN